MSIKRIINSSIFLASGATTATYTISPALSSMDKATLVNLGSTLGVSLRLELTNTTTITVYYGASSPSNYTIGFQLVEYN